MHDVFIDFKLNITQGKFVMYAKNSFVVGQQKESSGGIGLVNLKKRLDLLYPNKHALKTYTEANYFILELQIQLNP